MRAILAASSVFSITSWLLVVPVAHAATGHIAYVTDKHAYLDVGSEDGMRVGDTLSLKKTAPGSGKTCKVDAVSDHHARCVGDNLPRRARFVVRHAPPPAPPVSKHEHFGRLTRTRLQQVHTALAAQPFERVGTQTLSAHLWGHGYASLNHDVYHWFGLEPRTIQGERLELSARVAPLARFPDLVASVRLTALYWTQQANMPLRFDNGAFAQIYVWQGDVASRGRQGNLTFGVGRTLTWYTPGLSALDGAQVGYRASDNTYEVGAYAGTIPDPAFLKLNTEHVTAGAYMMARRDLTPTWMVSNTARLAYVKLSSSGRLELESRAELAHGTAFQAGLTPRLGVNLQDTAVSLDAVRFDMASTLTDFLQLYAGARYANANVDLSNGITGPPQVLRSAFFSDVTALFRIADWINLGAVNAVALDDHSGYKHVSLGPQVSFPHAFGRYGSLQGTFYVEESMFPFHATTAFNSVLNVTGSNTWIPGYSVFLQSILTPRDDLSFWARVSWMTDRFQTVSTIQQLCYYLRVQATLLPWLDAAAFVRVNEGLPNANVALGAPINILGSLQLTGHM